MCGELALEGTVDLSQVRQENKSMYRIFEDFVYRGKTLKTGGRET